MKLSKAQFEERLTEWFDGQLSGEPLNHFEKYLSELPEGEAYFAEKESTQELGKLLKSHLSVPALPHADFFQSQIQERIRTETRDESRAKENRSVFRTVWDSLFQGAMPVQIIAAGAACLLATVVSYKLFVAPTLETPGSSTGYANADAAVRDASQMASDENPVQNAYVIEPTYVHLMEPNSDQPVHRRTEGPAEFASNTHHDVVGQHLDFYHPANEDDVVEASSQTTTAQERFHGHVWRGNAYPYLQNGQPVNGPTMIPVSSPPR